MSTVGRFKILGVPVHDPYQQEFFDIADIPQHMLKEVEHFFHTYKDLEGKRVEIKGWGKSGEAMEVISESMARYDWRTGASEAGPEKRVGGSNGF